MGKITRVVTNAKKGYAKYVWVVPKEIVETHNIEELDFNGIFGDSMQLKIKFRGQSERNK